MKLLITGGCGFIGTNAAMFFKASGYDVVVVDNLSRAGSRLNLSWLQECGPIVFQYCDVTNAERVIDLVSTYRPQVILHLAAQVAVTTSVIDPRRDFETNALGTFNVLEAVRLHSPETIVLNASTNKVYGALQGCLIMEGPERYEFCDRPEGIGESQNLDFNSPYGCSKGAADQYVLDYARIYGVRTITFRQSCIYGTRQFGMEDQGWLAWFAIAHSRGDTVTIYGNGKQVRDVLFVDDLIECYACAIDHVEEAKGKAFNVGGGFANTVSLKESIRILETLSGRQVKTRYDDWRPGDQAIYYSNIRRASDCLDWQPKISPALGISFLYSWIRRNQNLFGDL